FFSSRRRHTRFSRDWSSDVCSSDLKDVADFGTADFVQFPFPQAGELPPPVADRTFFDPAGGLRDQTQKALNGDGFSGTGLTDDRQRFSLIKVKADAADRLNFALVGVKGHVEITNFQNGIHAAPPNAAVWDPRHPSVRLPTG